MARANQRGHVAESRRGLQDPLARDGVLAHQLPLDGIQAARLLQDRVRHSHLADVVQVSRLGEVGELLPGQTQLVADPHRQLGDLVEVVPQLGLALL